MHNRAGGGGADGHWQHVTDQGGYLIHGPSAADSHQGQCDGGYQSGGGGLADTRLYMRQVNKSEGGLLATL